MATRVLGRETWEAGRTEDGHRDYMVKFKVETDDHLDGPQSMTFASGLPAIGSAWTYGNDSDLWAFCTPYLKATPIIDGEPNKHWMLEYKFTTRPQSRCNSTTIENPLLEPQKVSGSFKQGTQQATKDKDGNSIKNTANETIPVDFDKTLPSVRIEQNVTPLELSTFAPMVNTVNAASMWGVGARQVKLSNAPWERKYYGTCNIYYTRTFEFDIDFSTFDRDDIPNKGTKMIRGEWSEDGSSYNVQGDPSDLRDFIKAVDKNGNPTEHFLTSNGAPSDVETFVTPAVKRYTESNFFLLGIPSSF